MAEGLVLDSAADLVDAAVPDPHHVKGVGHLAGMSQTRRQPGPERLGQVGGHHLDASQSGWALPVHRRRSAAALPSTMSMDMPLEIAQARGEQGGVIWGGGQKEV